MEPRDDVYVEYHDHVAQLVLNRAAQHNALSTRLADLVTGACATLAGRADVRCVVIASTSTRAFCVGADLKERNGFTDSDFHAQRPHIRRAFDAVRGLPMPVVAAVHGYALGGGYELALCTDLIVADTTAVVGLPEVTLGIVPGGGGTQLVARRAGAGVAADLLFTGRRVAAEEAARLRLVDRLVTTGTARQVAVELAAAITANSPVAVRAAKLALRRGFDTGLDAGLEVEDAAWRTAVFSADRPEGVAAFVEKRRPRWPAG